MNDKRIISFILNAFRPFKVLIAGQFIVAFVWAIDLSLRPYILKIIFDKIPTLTPETAIHELFVLFAFYLSMSLLITFIFRFYDFIWLTLRPNLKRHIGDTLMKRMMDRSQTFFQNHFAGNLANKINDVMNSLPEFQKLLIDHFFSRFLALIIAIFTVWTISGTFALVLAAWLSVFIIGTQLFMRKAQHLSENVAIVRSTIIGRIVDILTNMMSVRLFAAKRDESKTLKAYLDAYVLTDQTCDWWFLYMFTFQGVSFVIYQAVVFYFLTVGFKKGTVTTGDFALLLTLNISIIEMLWTISNDILRFSEYTGNVIAGLRIALTPIEIEDAANAVDLQITKGKITFDAVSFHYKDTDSLFDALSVTIEAGQKVGLVGYSVGGKTTFIHMILRLYDIAAGCIRIDQQNIKEVTQDSLHANIGLIPQDPSLFHRTLMDNIRYGNPNATDDAVMEAALRAHAHDFIVALPQGYQSLVGERGVKLSGGQRQRIAIARAILKNAPILILDEATSQLDSITEGHIQESLWQLMDGKTTIVIAHRLSTLLYMDRILVFDKGKIVEDGTHDELLARQGLYKTLWDTQVGGFLLDRSDNIELS